MEFGGIFTEDDLVVTMPYDDEGGTVTIRYMRQSELMDIVRKAQRQKWVKGKLSKEYDDDEANRLLGRACVVGWDGHTVNGEPLPYSPEACDQLMAGCKEFKDFVNAACTDYRAMVDAQREDSKKNSASMSSSG